MTLPAPTLALLYFLSGYTQRPDRLAGALVAAESDGLEAVDDPIMLACDHLSLRAMGVAHATVDRAAIALDHDDDRCGLLAVRVVTGAGRG
jgi:hypothetical protein